MNYVFAFFPRMFVGLGGTWNKAIVVLGFSHPSDYSSEEFSTVLWKGIKKYGALYLKHYKSIKLISIDSFAIFSQKKRKVSIPCDFSKQKWSVQHIAISKNSGARSWTKLMQQYAEHNFEPIHLGLNTLLAKI